MHGEISRKGCKNILKGRCAVRSQDLNTFRTFEKCFNESRFVAIVSTPKTRVGWKVKLISQKTIQVSYEMQKATELFCKISRFNLKFRRNKRCLVEKSRAVATGRA